MGRMGSSVQSILPCAGGPPSAKAQYGRIVQPGNRRARRADGRANRPNISTSDAAWLLINVLVLGGLLVLIAIRGPSVPAVLLAVGAAGMAIGKIGRAFAKRNDAA